MTTEPIIIGAQETAESLGLTRLTTEEYRAACAYPVGYKLAGELPDLLHKDVARIYEIVTKRRGPGNWTERFPGLVLQTSTPTDRWYVTFKEPDADHPEQWFYEASGGENELFGPGDLEAFLIRLDIPCRATKMEVRNGFRVVVYEDPQETRERIAG